MAITLTHDVDIERRPDPAAAEGNFRDTHIDESAAITNYGFTTLMGIGEKDVKEFFLLRSLVRFDLHHFIPPDATITAAVWHYYIQQTDLTGPLFRAVRCLRDWVEMEATWTNYKSGTAWGTAGAEHVTLDRDETVIDLLGTMGSTGWQSDSLINNVNKAWNDLDGVCNFLVEQYTSLGSVACAAYIYTKNYYEIGDPAHVHHLRVTYTLDGKTFQAFVFDAAVAAGPVLMAGTAAGLGGQAGLLGLDRPLAGTIVGQGATSGALTVVAAGDVFMAGTAAGLGAIAAALGLDLKLSGVAPGAGGLAGALGLDLALVGTVLGQGAMDGALVLSLGLTGTSVGAGGSAGLLGLDLSLAGTVAAQGGVTGVLALDLGLKGTVVGTGGAAGVLVLDVGLAGTAAGQAATLAILTVIEGFYAAQVFAGDITVRPQDAASIALQAVQAATVSLGPVSDLVVTLSSTVAQAITLRLADGRAITLDPERAATVALAAVLAGTATVRTADDGTVSVRAVITADLALALEEAGIISLKPTDEGGF